jgi:hypothetical protein
MSDRTCLVISIIAMVSIFVGGIVGAALDTKPVPVNPDVCIYECLEAGVGDRAICAWECKYRR